MWKNIWGKIAILLIGSSLIGGLLLVQTGIREYAITVTLCGGSAQSLDYFSDDYNYRKSISYPGGNSCTTIRIRLDPEKVKMGHRFDFGGKAGETFLISSIILEKPGYKHYVLDLDRAKEWIKHTQQLKEVQMLDHRLLVETIGNDGFLVTRDNLFQQYATPQFHFSGKSLGCAAVAEFLLIILLLMSSWLCKGIQSLKNSRSSRKVLLIITIFIGINFFVIFPAIFFFCHAIPDVFSIELKASNAFTLQLFYRVPYSENKSIQTSYSAEDKFQLLRLHLPKDSKRNSIRIDFDKFCQTIFVKDISILRYGIFRYSLNLRNASKVYPILHDIDKLKYRDGLLEISTDGGDPYMIPSKKAFQSNLHWTFSGFHLFFVCLELAVLFLSCIVHRCWQKNSWDIKRNIINSFSVAFVTSGFIFVIIPCQTLIAYQEDFQSSVPKLLISVFPIFVMAFFLLTGFLVVCRRIFAYVPHLLLLGFIFYEYLETGILSQGLPPLNGDISSYGVLNRCIWDTAILVVLLAVPVIFYRGLKKYIPWIALSILILASSACFEIKKSTLHPNKSSMAIPNNVPRHIVIESVRYAPKNNIMIFILDSVSIEVFHDVITRNKDIAKLFSGFVCYLNNLGMHIQTIVGVPGIMTGKYFENSAELPSYAASCFGSDSLIKPYLDSNIPIYINLGLSQNSGYTNAVDYTVNKKVSRDNTSPMKRRIPGMLVWSLGELSLFRQTPYICKRSVLSYIMENWPLMSFAQDVSNDKYLFERLASKQIDPTKKTVLNIHHSFGSHDPFIYTANGERRTHASRTYSAYYEQTCYIAKLLGNLFEKYREMGIYDSATIIVLADHGLHVVKTPKKNIPPRAFPFLMVKSADCKKTLCLSNLPTSHSKVSQLVKALKDETLSREQIEKILYTEKRFYREGKDDLLADWWMDPAGKVTYTEHRPQMKKRQDLSPLQDGKKYLFQLYNNPNYPDFLCQNMRRTGGSGLDITNKKSDMIFRVRKPDTLYKLELSCYSYSAPNRKFTGEFFFNGHKFKFKPFASVTISFPIKSDKDGFIELNIMALNVNYSLSLQSLTLTLQ